jgi:glycosyltransferase involved in cell wall biosynthesis
MEEPEVSVVIGVYNGMPALSESLESVLSPHPSSCCDR